MTYAVREVSDDVFARNDVRKPLPQEIVEAAEESFSTGTPRAVTVEDAKEARSLVQRLRKHVNSQDRGARIAQTQNDDGTVELSFKIGKKRSPSAE